MCYRQWYGGTSLSSSVERRLIISFYIISGTVVYLLNTFSGTLVCVIVSGTAVHLFHRQWYVDETFLFYIISGTVVYLLNTFNGTLVCVIVSGTAVHLFHRQWYVDELSLFISSVVRWYISLIPSVERWYVLSSVVRRYISFIVSGTSMIYLFLYHQWYGGISL